jgi:hypothetical protein
VERVLRWRRVLTSDICSGVVGLPIKQRIKKRFICLLAVTIISYNFVILLIGEVVIPNDRAVRLSWWAHQAPCHRPKKCRRSNQTLRWRLCENRYLTKSTRFSFLPLFLGDYAGVNRTNARSRDGDLGFGNCKANLPSCYERRKMMEQSGSLLVSTGLESNLSSRDCCFWYSLEAVLSHYHVESSCGSSMFPKNAMAIARFGHYSLYIPECIWRIIRL